MMTPEEYIESLGQLHPVVYVEGQKVKDPINHPVIRPGINVLAKTYELANDPQHEDLMTAISHLDGKVINRFSHIFQNTDDLIKKAKMLRLVNRETGVCALRCATMDFINVMNNTTYLIDSQEGTEYHQRFLRHLGEIQSKDLIYSAGATDAKGNRSKRPKQQTDPDVYVHVVRETSSGIFISGAKTHHSGVLGAHRIHVMPGTAINEDEQEYAVAFVVPVDAPGITFVLGKQPTYANRYLGKDLGNVRFDVHEAIAIFDNVFVPWEDVLMYKEWKYTQSEVGLIAAYHRHSYGACRAGVADVLIGAASLVVEYNGVAKASHVKDKLLEMVAKSETMYACSIAAAVEGYKLPSGGYAPNHMISNVAKLNTTRLPWDICRDASDLAGGWIVDMPSEQDLKSPEIGEYVARFIRGSSETNAEDKMKAIRLIENIVLGMYPITSQHGAGSPHASKIMMARELNIMGLQKLAKVLADIP